VCAHRRGLSRHGEKNECPPSQLKRGIRDGQFYTLAKANSEGRESKMDTAELGHSKSPGIKKRCSYLPPITHKTTEDSR
jgi:hypothetical protein